MTSSRLCRMSVTLIPLAAAGRAIADTGRVETGYYGHMWNGGWGIMGAGSMILFWVLVIVAVVVAVRWLSQQGQAPTDTTGSALRILEDRLAKGEIDVAEFEERKKALTS